MARFPVLCRCDPVLRSSRKTWIFVTVSCSLSITQERKWLGYPLVVSMGFSGPSKGSFYDSPFVAKCRLSLGILLSPGRLYRVLQ